MKSAVLPGGENFLGPAGLREALLARKALFIQAMTEKLLAYALGRQIEAADMPTVRAIVRQAGADDYRWGSIIGGIVESRPFLMRTASPPPAAPDARIALQETRSQP